MRRRALLLAGGAWLAAGAAHALAQASQAPRRIAFVHPGTERGWRVRLDEFRAALAELGYVEGRNLLLDVRWGNDKTERLGALAAEVVATKPEVIVTASSAGVAACKKATQSIPIVFASVFNPVEQGFVASLAHPGGNITGVILYSGLIKKNIEIAREALPKARRLAMLVHESDPAHRFALDSFEPTARSFNFEPFVVRIKSAADLDRAFDELVQRNADALFLPSLAFFMSQRPQIAERALKARLPLLATLSQNTESGGLLSYGTPLEENYRRAAVLVDKILRGAKPADLPVEQPERFQLIVNRRTATAIGVTLTPATVLRAERIID